ncbi:MAG: RNA polymerase sigma factor [Acidobacteriales bacterium]|nr:RNA polymerase sigma factor [Terriglobales bacterium]
MTQDEAAVIVGSLFESSYVNLVRYVFRKVGCVAVAEELVQDTLLDLYRTLRWGEAVEHPRAWAISVLQRKVHKEFRRRAKEGLREPIEAVEVLAVVGRADYDQHFTQMRNEVVRLLSVLTRREQEVVLLRMESLKYTEIARALGISRNSVNTLLARALHKLQAAARKWPDGASEPMHVEKSTSTTLQ